MQEKTINKTTDAMKHRLDRFVSCPNCLESKTLLGLALYVAKSRLINVTNEEYDAAFIKIEEYLNHTGFIEDGN